MAQKKLNVCITTVGGLTSPEIIRACRNLNGYKVCIVGVDPYEYAVGRYFSDYFEQVPYSFADEHGFMEKLNEVLDKYDIDILIPCGNEDNLVISKNRNLINSKIRVLVSDYENLNKALNKEIVYRELSKFEDLKLDFFVVNSYKEFLESIAALGFPNNPVVVKPPFGRGGRGVYILKDRPDEDVFQTKPYNLITLDFIRMVYENKNIKPLIVMEFLDEPFYSVYSLSKEGKNLVSLCHLREWGNASQTYRGLIEYREEFEKISSRIIDTFKLSYFVNMEFGTSRKDGKIKLFDLNPRIGASTAVSSHYGFNFIEYGIKLALEEIDTDLSSLAKRIFKDKKRFVRYLDIATG